MEDQNNNGIENGLDDFDGDGIINATEMMALTYPIQSASATSPPSAETDSRSLERTS